MHEGVRLFVKCCAEIIPCRAPIYEFGSLQVPGQEGYADMRQFFPGIKYVGCDMRAGIGVDRVENLEEGVSLPDNTAATVLCLETMEHVFNVFRAMEELKRILKREEGSVLLVSSPFEFGIHSHPFDYWRLTPECLARLLEDFDITMILTHGNPVFPRSVYGVAVRTNNTEKWRDLLAGMANRFQLAIKGGMGHDRIIQERLKMTFYRLFQKKKYNGRVNKTKISWSIREKLR